MDPLTLVHYILKVGVQIRDVQHARALWEQQEQERLSHYHSAEGALRSHVIGKQVKWRSIECVDNPSFPCHVVMRLPVDHRKWGTKSSSQELDRATERLASLSRSASVRASGSSLRFLESFRSTARSESSALQSNSNGKKMRSRRYSSGMSRDFDRRGNSRNQNLITR